MPEFKPPQLHTHEFKVLGRQEVRFERSLPSTREQTWAMLSDARRLASWFLPVTAFDPRPGGRYIIPTDNGPLDGVLTQFDPPRLIDFDRKMRFDLAEISAGTTTATSLSFTLARSPGGWIPSTLASFQAMLDNLELLLAGQPALERPAYMRAWRRHYPLCEEAISNTLAHGAKLVHRLHFPIGEDRPSDGPITQTSGLEDLHRIVRLLLKDPTLHIAVDGFADEPLDRDKAFRLSQRRADWVKARLIANGIAAERIATRAFGNYYRLHAARDEESTRLNRRVELIPLY